ncbi:MAG: acyl-CoA thioesterase [marine benthic group bacterium]|nr:acyl-CoA thioesterase [Candidatus Benthicola marisminoris]
MSPDGGTVDRTRIRVRYAETDQMGRAHHMQYLAWFELGRTELMRAAGVAYSALEREGIRLPVSNVQIEYSGAAAYDDLVEIRTWVSDVRSRTVTFSYSATRVEDGDEIATGSTRLVCANEDGRARRLPPHLVTVLQELLEGTERDVTP